MKQLLLSESYNEPETYERGNHHVGISMWHFDGCTEYRYKIFGKFHNLYAYPTEISAFLDAL